MKLTWKMLGCAALAGALLAMTPGVLVAQNLKLLVPAYAHPSTDPAMWTNLAATADVIGDDLVVIFNPDSGPGDTYDPGYISPVDVVKQIDLAGGTIIGYVSTTWNCRYPEKVECCQTDEEIEADIRKYYDPSYWPEGTVRVDGIFLDQVSDDLADVGFYQHLRNLIRGLDADALLIGNPGQATTASTDSPSSTIDDYATTMDALVTFESRWDEYLSNYTAPAWLNGYPADRFGHIIHTTPSLSELLAAISMAKARKAGYVYVTDDIYINQLTDNPYDSLATHWLSEVEAASSLVFAEGFESGGLGFWSASVP